jgi:pimeloyl-ACP methyl ester carboxylesterase
MNVTLRVLLAGLMGLGLLGCESLLSAGNAKNFPPPGRLVDVNGRNIQLDCRGSGSPTVVLEAGADIYGSLAWVPIHDQLATTTRVCAYSHAGTMWSDSRDSALDADGVARDLRLALRQGEESPPFVLVGHSRGAIYNLVFTDLYRDEVAGLVFLDPRHPDIDARRVQAGMPPTTQPLGRARFARSLRWTGIPRLFDPCKVASLPESANDACRAYFPHSLDGYISETQVLPAMNTRAMAANKLSDLPVIVLTRQLPDAWLGSTPEERSRNQKNENLWRELNAEIASWSSQGQQRLVPDSSHQMLISHSAAVTAVRDVVTMVREDMTKK